MLRCPRTGCQRGPGGNRCCFPGQRNQAGRTGNPTTRQRPGAGRTPGTTGDQGSAGHAAQTGAEKNRGKTRYLQTQSAGRRRRAADNRQPVGKRLSDSQTQHRRRQCRCFQLPGKGRFQAAPVAAVSARGQARADKRGSRRIFLSLRQWRRQPGPNRTKLRPFSSRQCC